MRERVEGQRGISAKCATQDFDRGHFSTIDTTLLTELPSLVDSRLVRALTDALVPT